MVAHGRVVTLSPARRSASHPHAWSPIRQVPITAIRLGWRHAISAETTRSAGPDSDRPGSGHPRSRGLRGYCGVAEPAAGHRDAQAEPGRRSFQAVVRHRCGTGGDTSSGNRTRRPARCRQPGADQPVHQPGRQADLETAAAQSRVGAFGAAEPTRPDVELATVRTFRQRRRVRGRGGAGEPSRRTGARPACRAGRVVPCRRGRALSGRRVRRLRHRRGRRRARSARRAADRPHQDPRRRSSKGGHSANDPTARAWCW